MKKTLSLLLILAMLLPSVCSCSETTGENETKNASPNQSSVEDTVEESEKPDRFADVYYNGKALRILTSVDTSDATNGDQFIRGTGEQIGEIVNDAVYDRNLYVSEKLGISLEFTEANWGYSSARSEINNLIMAGVDAYDIMANDLRDFAALSAEGKLHNVANSDILDLNESYWYKDAMEDLVFVPGGMYCLIGDYFTDSLASCHVLYVNESMLEKHFGSTEYINTKVFEGDWTYDVMIEAITTAMEDTNGDGTMAEGDVFGFTCIGTWGSAIPFLVGTGIEFISRTEDGMVEYCFNTERSVKILEKMNELFYNEGTLTNIADWSSAGLRNGFSNGRTLIMGYNRLGDLANLRDIDFSMGIVPYPKLDNDQESYVTSMHDITEIGAIPVTVQPSNLDFVLTCLEVLSIRTAEMVIPEYYENALKVKYVDGQDDAKMIDLIHDSIGSPFAVAYDNALGGFMLGTCFCTPLGSNNADFASAYKKNQKAAGKSLKSLTESFTNVLAQQNGAAAAE